MTASIAYDPVGDALLVQGRREGDGEIMLWRLTGARTAAEKWERLEFTGTPKPSQEMRWGNFTYIPEHDAFMLTLRSGSGFGGAGTRGGSACTWYGVADDCFRMYGLRFSRS